MKNLAAALLLACWGGVIMGASESAPPRVAIRTELGDIVLEIYPDQAPLTSANFLKYVDQGLFQGGSFYRVVRRDNQPGAQVLIEVIQGGLPRVDNPKSLPPIEHETTQATGLLHKDGVLSMARSQPGTAGSEFFICIGDQPELDFGGKRNPDLQGFAAFGRVVEGMDVVRAIQGQPADGQMLVKPVGFISVERVRRSWRFGFSERLRYVTWDNVQTLDRDLKGGQAALSLRTRLSLSWKPSERLEMGLRLANEIHQVLVPSGGKFGLNEVFIDNLYVRWRMGDRRPLDLTLGRQDLFIGRGLLVAEGTPLDETRSVYFNALRLDMALGRNHYLTGFICYQPEKDEILPVINSLDRRLEEQPETGLGLNYSWAGGEQKAEAALIYKKASAVSGWPELSLLTLDGRVLIRPAAGLSLEGEAAVQFGSRGDSGLAAWGLDIESRWEASRILPLIRQASGGIVILSGDNPRSSRWEGWAPLFSRWPAWSESYIYTLAPENGGRLAEWTNFGSVFARLDFELTKRLDLGLAFHRLLAPEVYWGTWDLAAGNGRVRGNLWVLRLGFKLSGNLTGHLLYEGFKPGSFYRKPADSYSFLRFELQLGL
jgi:cyclophilin family peptidyl-prolyl cis-trans isomerase